MEMENLTCGRDHLSLWLFPTVYQAMTPLQTATETGCAAEGTAAEAQSYGGWRSARAGGTGSTRVCGQFCKAEAVLGAKAEW